MCRTKEKQRKTKKSKRDLLKGKFSITLLNLVDIRVFIVGYTYKNCVNVFPKRSVDSTVIKVEVPF